MEDLSFCLGDGVRLWGERKVSIGSPVGGRRQDGKRKGV